VEKIAVLMTYFDRPEQIIRTFESILKTSYQLCSVYVVDDASPTPLKNAVDLERYRKDFNIIVIEIPNSEKTWLCPVIAYNKGIAEILKTPTEKIIIQNAECMHIGDVLGYVNRFLTEENYLNFGCISLNREDSITLSEKEISDLASACKEGATMDGGTAWYNHPLYRPVGYDFCGALTRTNVIKLNGYDERFAPFNGYGDNDLKLRIDRLRLNFRITTIPEPVVAHQWHQPNAQHKASSEIARKAGALFTSIRDNEIDNYKATHTTTKDF
jgi:glycosyltransferase involved in cell wall biosynthesis